MRCAQNQSLDKSLQFLHDAEDRLRVHLERVRKNRLVSLISIIERYCDGDLSLVLYLESERHWDIPRRFLMGAGSEAVGGNHSGAILRFDAANRHVKNGWDEKPVLVSNVQSVYGPYGVIPSSVGLYFVKHHLEQIPRGLLYSVPAKGGFKLIFSQINREFGESPQSRGGELCNGFDPGIVEGALEIVKSVPSHQCDRTPEIASLNIVLDNLVSKLRINLDSGHVALFQQLDPPIKPNDMMIGPFDF